MTPIVACTLAFVTYFLGYRFYSKFLAGRLFGLREYVETPAHQFADGVDFVATKPPVLFGHHYASITGLAPMLGPAIAVIWGWAPALMWVVLGSLLIGCVHDFSALVLSVRARGLSVGTIAEGILGRRAKWLFLAIIFFGISLAMGVFVFVIAKLFALYLVPPNPAKGIAAVEGYPQAVLPSAFLMIIAATAGILLKKETVTFAPLMTVCFLLSLTGIWFGLWLKQNGYYGDWWPAPSTWIVILLGYAFLASILPVWTLLQPRDFLNALLLYLGLGLTFVGLFVSNPTFDAPAFVPDPPGAPPMLPFVFILIACGAASGFHGLVSSGTTSKQLDKETDARPIGYGGMIGESLLGLLAVFACTAGFASSDHWKAHYASFSAAKGLPQKLAGFIEGSTSFLVGLGLPKAMSAAVIAMVVVSFALTTLDSATRLLRFNLEEMLGGLKVFRNRFVSSTLAVLTIAFFAFFEVDGKPAALALWALFGTTNQLLAGLTLILATLYLKYRGKPVLYTGIPAIFMLVSTLISMVTNLQTFLGSAEPNYLLGVMGGILLFLGVWLIVEAVLVLFKDRTEANLEIELDMQ